MANTYQKIAGTTVDNSAPKVIEFTSIPGTFTDLLLSISARTTANVNADSGAMYVRFNSSTSNFNTIRLDGYTSTISTDSPARLFATYGGGTQVTANTFNNVELYITNYASSNTKNALSFYGSEDATVNNNWDIGMTANSWNNTSAITNIRIALSSDENGNSFAQYSKIVLYGIKNTV